MLRFIQAQAQAPNLKPKPSPSKQKTQAESLCQVKNHARVNSVAQANAPRMPNLKPNRTPNPCPSPNPSLGSYLCLSLGQGPIPSPWLN